MNVHSEKAFRKPSLRVLYEGGGSKHAQEVIICRLTVMGRRWRSLPQAASLLAVLAVRNHEKGTEGLPKNRSTEEAISDRL